MGTLRATNLQIGESIVLDTVFMKEANSFFLNDSTVAIPTNGGVKLYNLFTKSFQQKPLFSFDKNYGVLQFSLNEDKSKAAILLLNRNKKKEDSIKDKLSYEVLLKIVELDNSRQYTLKNYDYEVLECCTLTHIGDILWHGNQLVYSTWNQLYYYRLGDSNRILIADNIDSYALDQGYLIFSNVEKGRGYELKRFSFFDMSIENVVLEKNKLTSYLSYGSQFFTVKIDNTRHAILSDRLKTSYYTIGVANKLNSTNKLILYKSKYLAIEQHNKTFIIQRFNK